MIEVKKYLTINEAIELTHLNRVNLENKSVQHYIDLGKLKFEDALKLTFKQRSNLECELTTGLEFPSQQFKR